MHVSKHSMWYFLGKNFGSKQTLRLKQSTRLCFLFSFQTVFYGQYSGGAQFRNIQLLYPASVCTRYGFLLSVKEISWVALDYVVVSVMVTWGTRTERRCNCCIFFRMKNCCIFMLTEETNALFLITEMQTQDNLHQIHTLNLHPKREKKPHPLEELQHSDPNLTVQTPKPSCCIDELHCTLTKLWKIKIPQGLLQACS